MGAHVWKRDAGSYSVGVAQRAQLQQEVPGAPDKSEASGSPQQRQKPSAQTAASATSPHGIKRPAAEVNPAEAAAANSSQDLDAQQQAHKRAKLSPASTGAAGPTAASQQASVPRRNLRYDAPPFQPRASVAPAAGGTQAPAAAAPSSSQAGPSTSAAPAAAQDTDQQPTQAQQPSSRPQHHTQQRHPLQQQPLAPSNGTHPGPRSFAPRAPFPGAAAAGRRPHHPGRFTAGGTGRPADPAAAVGVAANRNSRLEAELKAKEDTIAALKEKIKQQEAATAEAARKAAAEAARKAAADAEQRRLQAQREEHTSRKAKLNSAFGSAFATAAKQKAADAAAAAAVVATEASAPADSEVVKQVLAGKTSWEVLQLKKGAEVAEVKRRYKELARKLHPDKCSIEGATSAFQKVQEAYSQLTHKV